MIPIGAMAGSGGYAEVRIVSDNPQLAIEQFDAQPAGRVLYGFGEGWNEQEYNPATGVLWRWSSDKAALRVRAEGQGAGAHPARRDRGGVVVAGSRFAPASVSLLSSTSTGRSRGRC